MDIWSRLFRGTGPKRRQATQDNSQQRLAGFQRVYAHVTQVEQKVTSLSEDAVAIESIKSSLQRISSIIHDECRSPPPHLCIDFSSSEAIYITISRVGWMCRNENVLREAIGVFNALVDSEEDEFVDNKDFAESMTALVEKTISTGNIVVNLDIISETVELLFGIAAKIRLQPEILPVWFNSSKGRRDPGGHPNSDADFMGVTQKDDFPLCYHLIEHLHHEGRIGDFARTGLLYIFETASSSTDLEDWLVDSDIPTMMATGLGALYSQLSRKISILHSKDDMPMVLTLSDPPDISNQEGAMNVFSKDLQLHLSTFISYLTFWQDLLQLCHSASIKQTLLDHLKVLFLQQLLYPSILESSDRDGGSSVAVMYYLRQMLYVLNHPDLVQMILEYLLALPENPESWRNPPTSPVLQKRQSSLVLLTQYKGVEAKMNPSLFSLTDLILNSVRSSSAQTVTAALKLVSILIDKNHEYVLNTLIRTQPVQSNVSRRTIGILDVDTETYLSLAERISSDHDLDDAYDCHVKGITELLEAHRCTLSLSEEKIVLPNQNIQMLNSTSSLKAANRVVEPHRLSSYDPFLSCLYVIANNFFTNDIETNLSLTECLVTLASCPFLRLERWMVVDSSRFLYTGDNLVSTNMTGLMALNGTSESESLDSDLKRLDKFCSSLSRPAWASDENPPLLSLLQSLVSKLDKLREKIPSFADLLSTRKATFRTHDALTRAVADATVSPREITSSGMASPNPQLQKPQTQSRTPTPSTPNTPATKAHGLSSLPQRLFSETFNLSPSRKSSPSTQQSPLSTSSTSVDNPNIANARSNAPFPQHKTSGSRSPSTKSAQSIIDSDSTLLFEEGMVPNNSQPKTPPVAQELEERINTVSSTFTPMSADRDPKIAHKVLGLLTQRIRFFQDGRVELESDQSGEEVPKVPNSSPSGGQNDHMNDSDVDSSKYSTFRDNKKDKNSVANNSEREEEEKEEGDDNNNDGDDVDDDGAGSEDDTETPTTNPEFKAVSLNHVLTNTVVLQEFILELVALLQSLPLINPASVSASQRHSA